MTNEKAQRLLEINEMMKELQKETDILKAECKDLSYGKYAFGDVSIDVDSGVTTSVDRVGLAREIGQDVVSRHTRSTEYIKVTVRRIKKKVA